MVLGDEFKKPYYMELREFLKKEYAEEVVYPHNGRFVDCF